MISVSSASSACGVSSSSRACSVSSVSSSSRVKYFGNQAPKIGASVVLLTKLS